MIIGYWGERPGKSCVSGNMVSTGIALSIMTKKKIVFVEGKYADIKLEYAFIPTVSDNSMKEDYGYYCYGGIDGVLNKAKNNILTNEQLENELVRIEKTNIYYIPSSVCGNSENFKKDIVSNYQNLLDIMSNSDKLYLIEFDNDTIYSHAGILDKLDLVVVNASQQRDVFINVSKNRRLQDKAVFIIGSYDENSKFTVRSIRRKYGIDSKNITTIPYNVGYKDAVCFGNAIDFFDRNFDCTRYNDNYNFMISVKYAAQMIMNRLKLHKG